MKKKFIEVVSQYPLPILIHDKEDYFTWPVKMMKEKGFEVKILTKRYSNQKREEVIDGLFVKRFRNVFTLFFYLYFQKKNLVYAQGKIFPAFIGLICKKSVYTPHGSFGTTLPRYLRNTYLRFLTKFLFARFNKIIAITPYETEIYKKFNFKNNYEHIYNAIDCHFFNNNSRGEKFREKYKIGTKEQIILFVGNIHGDVKNINVLLKAFELVQKKIKNARLVVIGKEIDQEKQTSFFKQVTNNPQITLTGWLKAEKIAQALTITSVFVNTSKNEGHSLAVSEAACTGVHLCLSKIGPFTSVYKNNALYHNPYDHEKLSKNIIYYLNNKKSFAEKEANKLLIKTEVDIAIIKKKLFQALTR